MAANIKHYFSLLSSSLLLSLLERFKSIDRVAEASCSLLDCLVERRATFLHTVAAAMGHFKSANRLLR